MFKKKRVLLFFLVLFSVAVLIIGLASLYNHPVLFTAKKELNVTVKKASVSEAPSNCEQMLSKTELAFYTHREKQYESFVKRAKSEEEFAAAQQVLDQDYQAKVRKGYTLIPLYLTISNPTENTMGFVEVDSIKKIMVDNKPVHYITDGPYKLYDGIVEGGTALFPHESIDVILYVYILNDDLALLSQQNSISADAKCYGRIIEQ